MAGKKAPEPELLAKENQVIELRRAGITWSKIAEQTGYASAAGAFKAYQRVADRFIRPNIEELRDMELDRLDRLQAAVWGKALNGDVRSLDAVLRIIDKRAKLLGLDAPKEVNLKAEVATYDRDSIDSEVARLVALLDSGAQSNLAITTGTSGTDTD
jgi:hypothetical protein